MSQEQLSDFIYAAEHSQLIRKELKNCANDKMILDLARKYGYELSFDDLLDISESKQIGDWFVKSKVNPIKA